MRFMKCPSCGSEEIRAAECLELYYELTEDDRPGDLINGEDIFEGPGRYYFHCEECDHRWDLDGSPLVSPSAVPDRL